MAQENYGPAFGEIESFVRDAVKRWGLMVYELPKPQTFRFGTSGPGGPFSMTTYVEGFAASVFLIKICLTRSDEVGLPPACVHRLHEELKTGLKDKFHLNLQPVKPDGDHSIPSREAELL